MQMQGTAHGDRFRGEVRGEKGDDDHLRQGPEEVNIKLKPLRPAVLTFRPNRNKGTGKCHLIPMVDGIDIPGVKSVTLQQPTSDEGLVVITVRLPNGIIIE